MIPLQISPVTDARLVCSLIPFRESWQLVLYYFWLIQPVIKSYSEALNECSEPSIATNIFEILVFTKFEGICLDKVRH